MSGEQVKQQAGTASWLVLVAGAFAVSVDAGMMAIVGLVYQNLVKAPKNVPVGLWTALAGVLCLGCYAVLHHPALFWQQEAWWVAAAAWALAAFGAGSLAGHTGGAPPTDSL